jgi:predicted transposase YdaD
LGTYFGYLHAILSLGTLQERNEKNQERLAKEKAEQKAQRLAEMLKAMGIDTDEV